MSYNTYNHHHHHGDNTTNSDDSDHKVDAHSQHDHHHHHHPCAKEDGSSNQIVWGMGESTLFTFELYAMQDDIVSIHEIYEENRQKIINKLNTINKKNGMQIKKMLYEQLSNIENTYKNDYNNVISKRAKIIIQKLLYKYHESHHFNNDHDHDDKSYSNYNGDNNYFNNDTNNNYMTMKTNRETVTINYREIYKQNRIRLIDKVLTNYFLIGLIHLLFPHAIIINMVRDPLDILYSCYSTRFGSPSSSYTLYYKSLVHQYVQYLEIIQHFRDVLPYYKVQLYDHNGDKSRSNNSSNDDDDAANDNDHLKSKSKNKETKIQESSKIKFIKMQRLIDVRYEELVVSPERVMKRLRLMLDLSDIAIVNRQNNNDNNHNYNGECKGDYKANVYNDDITTSKTMHVVLTASKFQVKLPIYLNSIGKWKRYSYHLKNNLIPELFHYLPYLSSINALSFIEPCMLRYLQFIYKQPYYHKRYISYHHQQQQQQQQGSQQNYTY